MDKFYEKNGKYYTTLILPDDCFEEKLKRIINRSYWGVLTPQAQLDKSAINKSIFYGKSIDSYNSYCITPEELVHIESDIDDNYYFEVTCFAWYCMRKGDSVLDNKNVIISHDSEAWIPGLDIIPGLLPNLSIIQDFYFFEHFKRFRSCTVLCDNVDPRANKLNSNLKFVPTWSFLSEFSNRAINQEEVKHVRDSIPRNIKSFKKYKYISLLGKTRLHRTDFYNKVKNTELESVGILGAVPGHYDNIRPVGETLFKNDREVNLDWVRDARFWISHETHHEYSSCNYKISQLTEKTFKPIYYGMPFLINGGKYCLIKLEELGFKTFRDIFGDYHSDSYEETNNNIIKIINSNKLDLDKITEYCLYNHDLLMTFTNKKVSEKMFKSI